MKNRLLGMLLAAAMLFSLVIPAGAAEKDVFELESLGVIDSGFDLEGEVSRAEFAMLMVRLTNQAEAAEAITDITRFADVLPDNPYAKYIVLAAQTGLMKGTSARTFEPSRNVTRNEAVKTVVCVLGYGPKAEANGGYPNGYLREASQLGLLSGLSGTSSFTGKDLVKLAYNALDVNLMEPGANGSYTTEDTGTLRDNLLKVKNIYKYKGIVTATQDIWLYTPRKDMKADELEIDGSIYKLGKEVDAAKAASMLGMQVEYYVNQSDREPDETIVSIQPTNKNETLSIEQKDITSASGSVIEFESEDGKTDSLTLANSAYVLKNGRRLSGWSEKDFKDLRNGSIDFIDNNGDGEYEVALLHEYTDVVVDRVAGDMIYFKTGYTYSGKTNLLVDLSDKDKTFHLLDPDGASLELTSVEAGQVISIEADVDGVYYVLRVSGKTAEGMFSSRDDETFTIGDEEYEISVDYRDKGNLFGHAVTAKLNSRGEVVELTGIESTDQLGYVLKLGQDSPLGGMQLKIITAGKIAKEIKTDDTEEDNVVENPILKGKNASIRVFDTNEEIKINNKKYTYDQAESYFANEDNRVVKYTLNADGQLTGLKSMKKYGDGNDKYYNAYEKVFGKLDQTSFGIDDDSRGVCLPKNVVSSDDDYLTYIELNDNQKYTVSAYEVDEDTSIAELIVIRVDNMSADSAIAEKKIAVASAASRTIDENGDEKTKVTYFLDGEEKTAFVSDSADTKAQNLKAGDVFYYSLDPFDEISKVTLVASLSPEPAYYQQSASGYTALYGAIENVEYNKISYSKNRWVTHVTLALSKSGNVTEPVEIFNRNTPPIYLYKPRNNSMTVGSLDDVAVTGGTEPDRMFAYRSNASDGKIECVVIVQK